MLRYPADPRTRLRRPTLLLVTLGIALALTMTGCSLSKEDQPTSASQQPTSASQADSGAGSAFTAQTTAGNPIEVPGGRPSVVLFFTVECGGCGPTANALAQAQADDPEAANFVVVDVASYETAKDIKGFLDAYDGADLGYASDADGRLIADYQVTQLSTVLVLDADNKVVYRAIEPSADQIRAELAKATVS